MSPRAAARLETLGFTKVYDYEAGKSDWLAASLPSAGRSAGEPSAADAVQGDDIACHTGEPLGDVAKRVRAAGKDTQIPHLTWLGAAWCAFRGCPGVDQG